MLAEWLDVKRQQIEILSGASGRNKLVRIAGVSGTALEKLRADRIREDVKKLR